MLTASTTALRAAVWESQLPRSWRIPRAPAPPSGPEQTAGRGQHFERVAATGLASAVVDPCLEVGTEARNRTRKLACLPRGVTHLDVENAGPAVVSEMVSASF